MRTVLYAAMGVGAWLVWRRRDRARRGALAWFAAQLAIDAARMPLFFGARALTVAAVWVGALAVAVAVTIRRFWSVDGPAALLLVPYLARVCLRRRAERDDRRDEPTIRAGRRARPPARAIVSRSC